MDSKRQRGENFTRQDKELLLERVMERKDIVEMKKSDAVTAKAKERAWQDIANNYNVLTSFPRTPVALKICWENMKRKCRRAYATEMNAMKAGGKKRCVIDDDPLLDKVRDILNLTSDNYNNAYESNSLYNDGSDERNMISGIKEEQALDFGGFKAITYGHASSNWSESSSYRLKGPAANALRSSKNSPYIQTPASETSESETQDLDDTDTYGQDTNNYSPKASNSRLEDKRHMGEPSKTSPCVQRLTFETTSEGEAAHDDDQISKVNNNRNIVRYRRPRQISSLADLLTESKIELVKIAKEHAMTEEKRRNQLHDLQVQETRLKIIEEKKRIALYELRAQETELKIEVLKSKLENGIFD